ncbi:MAG TPA: tetratricopeptide repeat protein [Acidisarcina sp.]
MTLVTEVVVDALWLCANALDEDARQTFAAVSLFPPSPNTFSESAALTIAKCDVKTLKQLVDSGILTDAPDCRYAVHRLVAEAGQSLADSVVKERFADYFARYAQAHADGTHAIGSEAANILASFEYANHGQQAAIAAGMSPLLELRGDYRVWTALLERATAEGEPTADLQLELARCAEKMGMNSQAEKHAQHGLKLADKTDLEVETELLAILGHIEMNMGKNNEAREHLTRAVTMSEQIGSNRILSRALRSLGVVTTRLADYDAAERHLRRALQIADQARDKAALATLWNDIGEVLSKSGLLEAALEALRSALDAARQIGYSEVEAAALEGCASVRIQEGNYDAAISSLNDAVAIARRIGHRWYLALILNDFGDVSAAQGQTLKALDYYSEAIEVGPPDTPDVRAYALFGKARVYSAQNRREESHTSARQALAVFESMPHQAASEVREWMEQQALTP